MLKFLGKGGAFSTEYGNNSAYLKTENTLILFDCGEDVFQKVLQLNLIDDLVKNVTVLITHLHGDHVGSLSTLCHYMRIIKSNVDFKIIFPEKEKLVQLLNLMHVKEAEDLIEKENKNPAFSLIALSQMHTDSSFGYLLSLNDKTIFYSGDAKNVNSEALGMLLKGEIDYFYHEVAMNDLGNHTSFDILRQSIPTMYRQKVYCMHTDKAVEEKCAELGFNIINLEN